MRTLEIDGLPAWSKIGLGTWQFGSREWGYGGDYAQVTAGQIVGAALDHGITLLDTAEVYGIGNSERILGRALSGRREEAFVASKLFPFFPVAAPVTGWRARSSLRRLGIERLDLYQVHQPNPVVPDSLTMRGMRGLLDAGLVAEVGVSNYPLARWRRAEAALGRRVVSNQVRYNLVDRRPEKRIVDWAERTGRIVIAYSPLAQGFLTGKYDADNPPSGGVRKANPLFLPENLRRGRELIETLREVADAHEATPAQIALAWTVRHPNVVAIPGASRVEQVEANAAAAAIELTDDQAAALDRTSAAFHPVTGARATRGLLSRRLTA